MKTFKTALIIVFALALVGCTARPASGSVDITIAEADELIANNAANPDFAVLDIRTAKEFNESHIEGAVNIDYENEELFYKQLLGLDKDRVYLVYCRTGNRSGQAMSLFNRAGFKKVYHMKDGFQAWKAKLQ